MIILGKLKFGYWFSYGDDNEIDFTDSVVTQILGINGNGKSSIPLIVEEMLFNKNSKGIKKSDIPNRYANKGYWGQLTFSKDDDDYLVDLDRKASIKIKLFRNGVDISSHTATNTFKMIEDLMGTDFKTFSQLVYQNTNTSLQFLTATDTNRKKFFIDLLSLEDYVTNFELFKELVKEHGNNVTSLNSKISTIETWIAQNKLEDLVERPMKPVDDLDLAEDEREYAQLGVKISTIDKTNKAISKNEQYKQLLSSINIGELNAIEVEPTISYDREQSELGGLSSELDRRTKYVKKIRGLADTCPTCEQPVTASFKDNLLDAELKEIETLEEKIEDLTGRISSIKSNNAKYKHKQESIKEWEELFGSINQALPSVLVNKQDLQNELSELAIRISNARAKVKAVTDFNQNVAKHNSRVQVYIEQSAKFEQELAEASGKLDKEVKNLGNLELLKKAFSTNGLIAYKIENLVKDLESLTNEYLAELSDGRFTIEFSVTNDKLNVLITDNGHNIDIGALSSGELARVNTSTLLALRKLMSSISQSQINVLFLDEVISVLDESGRDRLVEVLLEENLNTYIVSHSWSHPLLTKLDVVKEDNMSRLEHYA